MAAARSPGSAAEGASQPAGLAVRSKSGAGTAPAMLWAEWHVEASPGSLCPGRGGAPGHVAPWSGGVQQQQATVQLEASGNPGTAAGSLPLPACSGALGWESTASSEHSDSPKTWSVEQVDGKSTGQLGMLDSL